MIYNAKPEVTFPTPWRRHFALFPTRINDKFVWLECYEERTLSYERLDTYTHKWIKESRHPETGTQQWADYAHEDY